MHSTSDHQNSIRNEDCAVLPFALVALQRLWQIPFGASHSSFLYALWKNRSEIIAKLKFSMRWKNEWRSPFDLRLYCIAFHFVDKCRKAIKLNYGKSHFLLLSLPLTSAFPVPSLCVLYFSHRSAFSGWQRARKNSCTQAPRECGAPFFKQKRYFSHK